jgi:hypothetical protein
VYELVMICIRNVVTFFFKNGRTFHSVYMSLVNVSDEKKVFITDL